MHTAASIRTADTATANVLIVDDDEDIRHIVTHVLNAAGYNTLTAAGADEAMSLMERFQPDVVITDALMPRCDGREFCRALKSDPRFRSTKVIIMTSLYKSLRYKQEAYRQFHADEYLVKPIDFSLLLDAIGRLLRRDRRQMGVAS